MLFWIERDKNKWEKECKQIEIKFLSIPSKHTDRRLNVSDVYIYDCMILM